GYYRARPWGMPPPGQPSCSQSTRLTVIEECDMALDPPFVVRVEKQPGGSSFGETMNNIRSWLDHRKIQPASFNSVFNALSGVGFEIAFNSEDEAHLFEEAFRA